MTKGIIYDLDGTIISTAKLHEDAWLFVGKTFNISITPKMLANQRGISNKAAALMMLPKDKKYLSEKFQKAKVEYVKENLKKVALFPSVIQTIETLLKKGYNVWICTSAKRDFVKKILRRFKKLRKVNVVWREMYAKEKPSPEALNITIKKMGLSKKHVIYVGDAANDYKTSINASVKFVYFCLNKKQRDSRIPKSTITISRHKEVLRILKK